MAEFTYGATAIDQQKLRKVNNHHQMRRSHHSTPSCQESAAAALGGLPLNVSSKKQQEVAGKIRMRRRIHGQRQQCLLLVLAVILLLLYNVVAADELRSRGFTSHATTSKQQQKNEPTITTTSKYTKLATAQEQSFMRWCKDFLGIHSMLEIAHFTYDAAVVQLNSTSALEADLLQNTIPSSTSNDTILVRGLAAKEDIHPGDVVIRIPINALMIRDTVFDLAKFVLLEANETMPLYRQIILGQAERHHHEWIFDTNVLSVQSETFRIMARNLRDEIKSLYYDEDWKTEEDKPNFQNFSWAFQLVNGRHWRVPFPQHDPSSSSSSSIETILTPPANTPTQSWVGEDDDEISERPIKPFLAPIADLMNFGPPCTRVRTEHGFEVISTCEIPKGHEVTFWYSDMCADAVLAVYGMTLEMIAPCKSAIEWKQKASILEKRLKDAVDDIEILEMELEEVESMLSDCCEQTDEIDEEEGPSLRRGGMGRTRSKRYSLDGENEF